MVDRLPAGALSKVGPDPRPPPNTTAPTIEGQAKGAIAALETDTDYGPAYAFTQAFQALSPEDQAAHYRVALDVWDKVDEHAPSWFLSAIWMAICKAINHIGHVKGRSDALDGVKACREKW